MRAALRGRSPAPRRLPGDPQSCPHRRRPPAAGTRSLAALGPTAAGRAGVVAREQREREGPGAGWGAARHAAAGSRAGVRVVGAGPRHG